ncbi:ABC transporter substrate-binding protein [Glaciihabitans sp. dw_435]|uniref:ABC transporter substrate-binding protein n=1 Tax=Glaciihabitans sp. dw_435 TaxID=2720081 RepID=UPI001BD4E778|nr:ABC transporter substrate-binding protein [Glaciihabitans sp. dw_435]
MLLHGKRRTAIALTASIGALALVLTGCSNSGGSTTADGKVALSFLTDNAPANVSLAEGLAKDFNASQDKITVKVETRPGGSDGDNIIKTRLATGEMTDIFLYNSGSLFQAIAPEKNLVDFTNESFADNVMDSMKPVVSVKDKLYGVPVGGAFAGAILYNKKVYKDLGLTVPLTWDQYNANNDKIKAAGKTAIIQTYKDTWTSQLDVLGDFANVLASDPDWATKYTENKAKYATDPVAMAGFEHLQEGFDKGYYNKDFGSATNTDGLRILATGEGVHYPMLTSAAASIIADYPDAAQDIGVFATPGDDPAGSALTTWFPNGLYVPAASKNVDAAKEFIAFAASTKGCDSETKAIGVTGPYLIKGCDLPADVPAYVGDLLPYFNKDGGTQPALEFLSPIKGPSLEQITVAVGSGITSAAEGAKQYDADVKKQAQQLGLSGW